jgi:hypothetical protein
MIMWPTPKPPSNSRSGWRLARTPTPGSSEIRLALPDPRTGRLVTFGLARGSADLIGWRTVMITPDMVGQQLAVFTSIEVKTPTGRVSPQQQAWLGVVQGAGGIAGVARSVEDAVRIIEIPSN